MVIKTESALDIALKWLNADCSVFPLQKGRKIPAITSWKKHQTEKATEEEIRAWFDGDPNRYDLAVVTGAISGITAIDLDRAKGGKKSGVESIKEVGISQHLKGDVLINKTSGGGFHIILDYNDKIGLSGGRGTTGVLEGVDIRNNSNYIKVYGNNNHEPDNPSSVRYETVGGRIERRYFKEFYHPSLTKSEIKVSTDTTNVSQGSRNDSITSFAGKLKKNGLSQMEAVATALTVNKGYNPPLPEEEVYRTVEGIFQRYPEEQIDIPLTDLSDVKREYVQWLWEGYIPKGKLTIFAGTEGVGKGYTICDLLTKIALKKPMPDGSVAGSKGEGESIYLCFEDGIADTIKARVEDMGFSGKGIKTLDFTKLKNPLSLKNPKTIEAIRRAIGEIKPEIVVIDPLSSIMGGVDDKNELQVRPLLEELSKIAQDTAVAFVLVKHLRKAQGDTLASATHSITGSVAYSGVVRQMLFLVTDKDDSSIKYLENIKHNLTIKAPSMKYQIVEGKLEWELADEDFDYQEHLTTKKGISKVEKCASSIISLLGAREIENKEMEMELKEYSKATIIRARKVLKERGALDYKKNVGGIGIAKWFNPDTHDENVENVEINSGEEVEF